MIEKGLKKEFVEKYCQENNLDFEPKKEEYALWNDDYITFSCIKCSNFFITIKSLAHWKKNAYKMKFECPGCIEEKKQQYPENLTLNYDMNDLPLNYRLKLAKQNKWLLAFFENVKELCVYECVDCRTPKTMLPHNLFLPRHFTCVSCKHKII